MKKLEKQLVSALAIGIGAGLMMCPVTAYADEGEPEQGKDDGGDVTQNSGESQNTETSGTQETSETSQAASDAGTAIDTAQTAIADTGADKQDSYSSANNALNVAEGEVAGAKEDIADAENAAEAAVNNARVAGQMDSTVDSKSVEAVIAYGASQNDSKAAISLVDGIDVQNDSFSEAETKLSDAEDKVTEAEKKDFDAGKVLSDAETASANAKTALDNITKQNNTYETELGYAEQELERAETALSAAEDDVKNNQSAQEQALAKLDDHIGKQIKELREEVISMNEDDPDFQNKVNELGKLIAENLFLDEDEKEAYEKGEFTFEYSVNEDKDVIIRKVTKFEVEVEKVIPGSPEGFYSEDGELFKENHYSYYVYNENEVYAANSSEPAYTQDNNPVSGSATDDGEPWDVYEEIPGTTLIRGTSELRTVDGHDQYYVKETTKKCYNVTTYKKVVAYDQAVEIVDAARGQAETEADNIIENLLKDNSGFIEASREFVDYEIPPTEAGGMIKWGCKIIVTLKSKEPDVKEIAVLEETYEAKMFAYRAEVEPQYTTEKVTDTKSEFVAFSDTGAPRAYENDYVEKKAIAEDAVSKAQAATTAYEDALSKVSAAREKVEALKNAGAPVSQEKIEQAANAHTAALANLETAQSAKRASQEKLKEARQALETAQQKINDIKERDRIAAEQAQQASNEEGADGGSDEGTNGGSDDNGSGNGGSGSNGSDNGNGDNGGNGDVIPGAGHQITGGGNTTINPASGAEVISLVTNPAGNPATQYRSRRAQMSSLAQSLTNEILGDNSGSVTDIAAASNTDKAKELAQAAGTTAQSAVASAFNTTLNKSAVQIGDNDVALASTPSLVDAETSDKKTPLMLMLLGIAAAGVAGASAELITRRRDR